MEKSPCHTAVFSQCGLAESLGFRHKTKKGDIVFSRACLRPFCIGDRVVVPEGLPCRAKLLKYKTPGTTQRQSDAKSRIESPCVTNGNTYDCIANNIQNRVHPQDRRSLVNDWGRRGLGALLGGSFGGGKGAADRCCSGSWKPERRAQAARKGRQSTFLLKPGLISELEAPLTVCASLDPGSEPLAPVKTFRRTRSQTDYHPGR